MDITKDDVELANELAQGYQSLISEISKVIVGQQEVIKLVLTGILSRGHCLLVGVPGLAKTSLINTIAQCIDMDFKRIQFTPDLMPSDITGSETMDSNRQLKFVRGPIFANIVLADEINRTPPKTQSALLEAMQEQSITIAGENHELPSPFFVLATQNPIEQEGTYPLPEAQLDRFMLNVLVDYPSFEEEVKIIKSTTGSTKVKLDKVLKIKQIKSYQELVRKVPVADNVVEYAVRLVHKTRPGYSGADKLAEDLLEWGAGPRASQCLIICAKCNALLQGKYSPDIEDVKAVALPVLRHRLLRNFKAESEGISVENIIQKLL